MKIRLLALLSVVTIAVISFYSFRIYNEEFNLELGEEYTSSFTMWAVSSSLTDVAEQFQESESIKVNIRQFQDHHSLIEELLTLHTGQNPPDLVEVSSHYGLGEINDIHSVLPINEVMDNPSFDLHEAFHTNFSIDGDLLAFPIGLEIPVMYRNHSLLGENEVKGLTGLNDDSWNEMVHIQEQINRRSQTDQFWLTHTDNLIPWYWKAWSENDSNHVAADWWEHIYTDYELSPALDHHMAITRFANYEVGTLIASSTHMSSIQQLVGNTFSINISPLFAEEGGRIVTAGNGLVVLTDDERADQTTLSNFLTYVYQEENMLQVLSDSGMIPASKDRMHKASFIRALPMSQHIEELLNYEIHFKGTAPSSQDRVEWYELLEESNRIEAAR